VWWAGPAIPVREPRSARLVAGGSPDRVTYTPLADLPTATEKARRDAPAIAVCEV